MCWMRCGDMPRGGQAGGELLDTDGVVGDRDPQRPRDRFGDAVVVHLDRAVQGIGLAVVWLGVLQDARDHIRLVYAGDGSVTAGSEGEPQDAMISLPAPA